MYTEGSEWGEEKAREGTWGLGSSRQACPVPAPPLSTRPALLWGFSLPPFRAQMSTRRSVFIRFCGGWTGRSSEPGLDRSRAFPSAAQGDSGWHGPVGRRGGPLAQNSGCSLWPGWGQGPQSLPVRSTNRAKALWSLEPRCTEATTQHTVGAPVAPPTGQGLLPQPWIPRLESLCLQTQGVHCPSRAPGSRGRNGERAKNGPGL